MQNKAVFVDRDGTINIDGPYLSDPDKFQMYPGVGEGVSILRKNGYKVIIITNQSGIGRGYFTEDDLSKIHEKMRKEFQRFHTDIDGIYYCPHHPDNNCDCRKPKTKLFEQAIRDHNIDVKKSYMLGDAIQDIEAGKKIGLKTILIPVSSTENIATKKQGPDYIASNFTKAVEWILRTDAMK
jgi:D,D-heptose 1,7-bisphosphate phosphatase